MRQRPILLTTSIAVSLCAAPVYLLSRLSLWRQGLSFSSVFVQCLAEWGPAPCGHYCNTNNNEEAIPPYINLVLCS